MPFPRAPNRAAAAFPARFRRAVAQVREHIRARRVDVVVGFGGYASAPAYVAARRERVPFIVHEANARPGMANVLGARRAAGVGVAFEGTPLRRSRSSGCRCAARSSSSTAPRSAPKRRRTSASIPPAHAPGVRRIAGREAAQRSVRGRLAGRPDAGWQLLHVTGEHSELADPGADGYAMRRYVDRMDLAFALADLVVVRAPAPRR